MGLFRAGFDARRISTIGLRCGIGLSPMRRLVGFTKYSGNRLPAAGFKQIDAIVMRYDGATGASYKSYVPGAVNVPGRANRADRTLCFVEDSVFPLAHLSPWPSEGRGAEIDWFTGDLGRRFFTDNSSKLSLGQFSLSRALHSHSPRTHIWNGDWT